MFHRRVGYELKPRAVRLRLGAAIGVAICAAVVAACSGGSGPGHSSSTGAPGAKNTDGTITIGTLQAPGTLDPATSSSGADYAYLYMVFDRLLQRNPDTGVVEPMLAKSWKFVGPKKLELDVQLRHGVTFQDGTPFNAQAVATYSKRYIKNGDAGNNLQYVTDVTTDGDYTVVYHLSQQNAQLLSGLADRGGMIPSPAAVAKYGKRFSTHPVGAGPYKFVSQVQGASYDFTRYDGYWNDANLPRIKNLDFTVFQSDTSLVNGIRSGNVNVAAEVAPQDVGPLKQQSGLDVAISPGISFQLIYFNGAKKPLDDRRVRLAFNLALNRKAIAQAATDGLGRPATEDQPPGTLGYVKSLDPLWPYDPGRAKDLVKQAGYTDGADLTCYEYTGEGYETVAPIMIAQEKAVGINLKVVPGSAAQVTPFFTGKSAPQCFMATGSGQGNPFYAYLGLWSKAYYNAGKTSFGVDQYYDQLFSTYSTQGENQIFYNINKAQQTDPGYSILYERPDINVYQSRVGGWVKSPLNLDNWQGLYYRG
jgi:peptide/nickel transport system substrate-binding protein